MPMPRWKWDLSLGIMVMLKRLNGALRFAPEKSEPELHGAIRQAKVALDQLDEALDAGEAKHA